MKKRGALQKVVEWCRISDNRCISRDEWAADMPGGAKTATNGDEIEAFTTAKIMVEYERYSRMNFFAATEGVARYVTGTKAGKNHRRAQCPCH